MNKDNKNLSDAYEMLLEAKKKLSPAQKKIAAAAPPPDEITGADFKALKGKKIHEAHEDVPSFERHSIEDIYNAVKGGMSLDDFAAWVKSVQTSEVEDHPAVEPEVDSMASIEAKRLSRPSFKDFRG